MVEVGGVRTRICHGQMDGVLGIVSLHGKGLH